MNLATPPRRFGELRSLLHTARPNAQRWDELCTLVDRWPDVEELVDRILPYACAQLGAHWPDELRKISADARAQCISHSPPPCTALCLELDLSYHYFLPTQRLTNSSFARMLESEWFGASAISLTLSNQPVGDEALLALSQAPLLSGLEHLTLDYTCVGPKGLEHLAHSPLHTRLEKLSLANLELDDVAMNALAQGELLTHLKRLDISRNRVSDVGIRHLVNQERSCALRDLDLSFNALTDEGAFLLAATSHLPELERLIMDYNDVGISGWRALVLAPHLLHAEVSCYPVR